MSALTASSIIASVSSIKSSDLDICLFFGRFPDSAEGQILVARQNESFFQEAFDDLFEDFEKAGLPRSVRNATFSFLQGNAPRVASRTQKKQIQARLSNKNRTALVELFYSPRVAVEVKSRGICHSGSFGIAHGWDLTKDSSQREVWSVLDKDKPYLVILSPMCRAFSQMMESNWSRMDPGYRQNMEQECLSQLKFCLQVAEYQVKHGSKFFFEHPLGASSWACDGVKLVGSLEGVFCTEADLCQFGLSVVSGELSKKPTRFMSNDPYILGELHGRCQNEHKHRRLEGDLPLKAQRYPPLLVKAIVDGLMESLSDHIDGKTETFTLIPNPEPGAQEDESDDEEDTEKREGPKVRYPADPSPNVRVELPKHLQEQVKRVHVNHAHPPKSDFIRMLKVARAKEQVIDWVRKEFSCEECDAQRKPSWRRKAAMPRTYHFNRVVAVDLFFVDGKDGQITILNMLDHGTGLLILLSFDLADCFTSNICARCMLRS